MKPTDLPDPESHPHGTRARYVALKCRCDACRAANTAYYHTVKARGRLVQVARARRHLAALSARGVGYKAVAAASDVAKGLLRGIMTGKRAHIREETERRILAVDRGAAADHAIVDGRRTHRAIAQMLGRGLTKTEIAQRLGYQAPALQIKPRVIARTEARVLRLLAEVRRELAADRLVPRICPSCGLSHARVDRLRVVARMLPVSLAEVHVAWPCLYENTNTGHVRFLRDRRALGAKSENPVKKVRQLLTTERSPRCSAPGPRDMRTSKHARTRHEILTDRLKALQYRMSDAIGDPAWLDTDLAEIEKWISIDADLSDREWLKEAQEQLLDENVLPEHAGAPPRNVYLWNNAIISTYRMNIDQGMDRQDAINSAQRKTRTTR